MDPKLLILACESYRPELDHLVASGRYSQLVSGSFECRCGQPPSSWNALRPSVPAGDHDAIHVFGSACLQRLQADPERPANVFVHKLDLCHELIAPRSTLDSLIRRGAYLVTAAWLAQWPVHLEALGAGTHVGRTMFRETCKLVALLDTGLDPCAHASLREFSAAVGLAAEIIPVSLDLIELRTDNLMLQARVQSMQSELAAAPAHPSQRIAEYAMALDVFSDLASMRTEREVVDGMFQLFNTLIAPRRMVYVPILDGRPGQTIAYPNGTEAAGLPVLTLGLDCNRRYQVTPQGFCVALLHGASSLGCLHAEDFAFPEHRDRYLNLALHLSGVSAMAIAKARQSEVLASTERSLADEKERLFTTLESIGDGVVATDGAGRVTLINLVAEQLTGWTQRAAVGRAWSEVLQIVDEKSGAPILDLVDRVLSSGAAPTLTSRSLLRHTDESTRLIANSAAPIRGGDGQVSGAVVVFRDITHTDRIERELQRVEKLESLGVFAGGLAHDFNNLLAAILGNLSLARGYAQHDADLLDCIKDAHSAGVRAKDLTRQLLTFARGGAPVKASSSLEEIINDSVRLCLRGAQSRAQFDIPQGLWPVDADAGQIGQVVQNLIINADQASPQGGVVRIVCENIEPDLLLDLPLARTRHVKISVIDQGHGIPEDCLTKIFDPFFTTKPKGSGLGLSVAFSIVKRHDGFMVARSEPGAGAIFEVYLPAANTRVDAPVREVSVVHGTGRILLMDDDDAVRKSTARALGRLGYVVESVADGAIALERYRIAKTSGEGFDLVVLDMTVPGGMGGLETAAALIEFDPHARAVACSGYSNAPVMVDFRRLGFVGAIAKPFDMAAFSQTIQQALRSPRQ